MLILIQVVTFILVLGFRSWSWTWILHEGGRKACINTKDYTENVGLEEIFIMSLGFVGFRFMNKVIRRTNSY